MEEQAGLEEDLGDSCFCLKDRELVAHVSHSSTALTATILSLGGHILRFKSQASHKEPTPL